MEALKISSDALFILLGATTWSTVVYAMRAE